MHFCADEVRAVVSVINHPGIVWMYVKSWCQRLAAWVRTKCRRCPSHCP